MARTQVQTELIATNAISGTIIADNAITSVHIATNSISGVLVQDSGVTTTMIAANNVTAAKIVSDGVETRHLHSNVVSGLSAVTAASGDYLLIGDTSDSNNLKKALVSDISTDISGKLSLSGGTMTGDIAHAGDFTLDIGGDLSLDAAGDQIRFKDSGTEVGNIDMGSSNLDISSLVSDKDIIFRGNDGGSTITAMTIDMSEGGRVGIGTTSPAAGLMIQTSSDGTGLSGDDLNVAYFHNQEATASRNYGLRVKAGSNATDYAFRVDTLATNGKFEVDGLGDVGIGGAPGTAPLSVYSDAGAACLRLIGRDNGTSDESCISFFDNGNSTETALILNVGANLAFHTNGSEKMRLTSDGYLGLGTTAPTALLETYNAANYTKHWRIHRPGTAEFGIGTVGSLLHISSGSSMPASSNKGLFLQFNTGELGLWKEPTSGVALDVNGVIRANTGIEFGSDTAAANQLDDYEEGTWGPTIANFDGTQTSFSHDCKYTRIGRLVTFSAKITSNGGTTSWGISCLIGLPITGVNGTGMATWQMPAERNNAVTAAHIGSVDMMDIGNARLFVQNGFHTIASGEHIVICGFYIAA